MIKKRESSEDHSKAGFYVSILLLGVAAVLGMALVASATFAPNLPAQVYGLIDDGEYSDVELVFNQSDVSEVNERLEEDREFGWCIHTERLGEKRFRVDLREGDNMNRSSGSVSFSCSVWETGRLHTHPGIWSVPYPSRYDREAFKESSRRFDCVAAGRVNVKKKPIGLNCYQKSEAGIQRVTVEMR